MPKGLIITTKELQEQRSMMYNLQCKQDPIVREEIPLNKVVLDHCHKTDHCRAALHRQSNAALGKIENAYIRYIRPFFDITIETWLRNVAEFLEGDYTGNALHPGWLKRCCTKFNSLNARQKDYVLTELGAYQPRSNDDKRKLAFRALLTAGLVTKGEVMEIIEHARCTC